MTTQLCFQSVVMGNLFWGVFGQFRQNAGKPPSFQPVSVLVLFGSDK
jgi:hypothetical protein